MTTNGDVLIRVENLQKAFGDFHALNGITEEIHKGEVVVIIGPSGSGKSTFLRSLNLLEVPTGGHIYFEGVDITDAKVDIDKHRQKMGMVFQHFNLFPHKTILENITLAPIKLLKKDKAEAEKEARVLLKRVGLEEKADSYPSQLSGGQKQRVAIAGVVAMDPKCIVMDEPTAMLDPVGRKEVLKTVHKLRKQKNVTVILITHYMEEVIDADYVYVMDGGKLVMDGTPRQIFTQVEMLKSMRLDVPQVTELAYELKKAGLPIKDGIIRNEELVEELKRLDK